MRACSVRRRRRRDRLQFAKMLVMVQSTPNAYGNGCWILYGSKGGGDLR